MYIQETILILMNALEASMLFNVRIVRLVQRRVLVVPRDIRIGAFFDIPVGHKRSQGRESGRNRHHCE